MEVDVSQVRRCARHGLHYDATVTNGCVLCRRGSRSPSPRRSRIHWIGAGSLGALLVAAMVWAAIHSVEPDVVVDLEANAAASARASSTSAAPRASLPPLLPRRGSAPINWGDLQATAQQGVERCNQGDARGCLDVGLVCRSVWRSMPRRMVPGLQAARPSNGPPPPALTEACRGGPDDWLKRACDGDIGAGCTALALESGSGQRRQLLARGCDLRDASACTQLAMRTVQEPAQRAALLRYARAIKECSGASAPCDLPASWRAWVDEEQDRLARGEIDEIEEKCSGGQTEACRDLAARLEAGTGVVRDPARAAQLRRRLCDRRDLLACERLAKMYARGSGVPRSETQALHFQERADRIAQEMVRQGCDRQKKTELCLFAEAMVTGRNPPGYEAGLAPSRYERRCSQGDAAACSALVSAYGPRGPHRDAHLAREYTHQTTAALEGKCNQGDAQSCAAAAQWHFGTVDGEHNPRKAREFMEKACQRGVAGSCLSVSGMYERGDGGPRRPDQVEKMRRRYFELARQACARDEPDACLMLSGCYDSGIGVAQDKRRAEEILRHHVERTKRAWDQAIDAYRKSPP